MCVVRDTVNLEIDEHLATFVVESHRKSHPDAEGTLPEEIDTATTTTTTTTFAEQPVLCFTFTLLACYMYTWLSITTYA